MTVTSQVNRPPASNPKVAVTAPSSENSSASADSSFARVAPSVYVFSITAMFMVGGTFAMLMRLHLTRPEGLFSPETYNRFFTMHGVIMVFFFLVPSIPATLGNFLLPIMIGAKDLAFPRVNLLSWYLYIIGAVFAVYVVAAGGVDTGWTFYAPYSTTYSNSYVLSAAVGVFVAGFSSITTGLNFIVTVHKMRAPGMTWMRMPLFVWAHYATGLIQILGTPVVAIALVLVGVERVMHVGIFDPNEAATRFCSNTFSGFIRIPPSTL